MPIRRHTFVCAFTVTRRNCIPTCCHFSSILSEIPPGGTIWRVQFDTYEREVERYGGSQGVVLGERIWNADSDAVMSIVSLLDPGTQA